MEIDGPNFVPKGGYFSHIWVKVFLKKLVYSYVLNLFYELAFQTKFWLFQTKNPPLSLFLVFVCCFSQFPPRITSVQYCGGYSVLQGDSISTAEAVQYCGDSISTVGDSISTVGG